ncbi:hypothetical protein AMATHDRAFT_353 [Amanita thiersii Skay4041]|uniref:Exocyst complex component Sec3 PIP2-binding N-terminal domain-containing protein n=1 Tax=Amanita thiersii Skay4041 TaxID=703135 RepID=A0A2A9P0Y3_9AGAR|nr:hypothetical protein AMATHDRAFT_353 [Amanita thiersii Skay4041]
MLDERQRIIASVFSRRNAHGSLEESYVSHVKIWEDVEGGGKKPRYILLSQASNGTGYIHKSKLNSNGTFSVGKTWLLPELRAIYVLNPLAFNITLARTYKWNTENQVDQANFLESLIRLFRIVTSSSAPLHLEGISEPKPLGDVSLGIIDGKPAGRSSSPSDKSITRSESPRTNLPRVGPVQHSNADKAPAPDDQRDPTPIRTRPPSISIPPFPASQASQTQRLHKQDNEDSSGVSEGRSTLAVGRSSSLEASRQALLPSPEMSRTASPASFGRSRGLSNVGAGKVEQNGLAVRRDPKARISFFDMTNQGVLERLLAGDTLFLSEIDGEEESVNATMANVEEMLEGYEWASDDVLGRKSAKGAVDLIEARLADELSALEKANIHSFLESDDRVGLVINYMDEAIAELDNLDSIISSYKIHLNAVGDDISHIQGQNRGLQVQTQNQRALLSELENLLQTVHVNHEALITLTQESLEKARSIERLEEAATELYKALQAGRDTDMAATMERLQEYRTHNSQFCKRIHDFLSIMFSAQSKLLLGDTNGLSKTNDRGRPVVVQHDDIETYLGRYSGLMLYLKEMDEHVYSKLCSAYFSSASELHATQLKELLSQYLSFIRKAPEDDQDQGFITSPTSAVSRSTSSIRRAGTLIRSPIESRIKEKDKGSSGQLRVSEAFGHTLEEITKLVYRENDFIADFLQINDAGLTFADYMGLDNYFRRQATRASGLSQGTTKLMRGAMDFIFGFLPPEMKTWIDNALAKDSMEIVGVLAVMERFITDAEERNNLYLQQLLGKQHARLKGVFDRHINEQLKSIEQTKLTLKKRRGVVQFVKHFPVYISRIENQLINVDGLEIRTSVDSAYEKIVHAIFDCLKQMAKQEGEGEDKGQLNYHVIIIENMHHFVAETSSMEVGSVQTFTKKAEYIYEESLNAYVKIVVRRPFAKITDFFDGVERLLKNTTPNDIANNATYNKGALKKVLKEFTSKDVRKQIDALYKRVEKHFTEASEKTTTEDSGSITSGPVMVGVWKACEEEILRITEVASKMIAQCYDGSGIGLEYTSADVEAAFRRQRQA